MEYNKFIESIKGELNINFSNDLESKGIINFSLNPKKEITALTLHECNIKNLTGILHFLKDLPYLTELSLTSNQLIDISPLADLQHLKNLNLGNNQIEDISPLKKLKMLDRLSLNNNNLRHVLPLRELNNLRILNLAENKFDDRAAFGVLTQITSLNLNSNRIFSIHSLSDLTQLRMLDIGNNQIGDINILKNLKVLTTLNLNNNNFKYISILKELTTLNVLYLAQNMIDDISALKKLNQITTLNLHGNRIFDISPLREMSQLGELVLNCNPVFDLSPLNNLKKLKIFSFTEGKINNLSFLDNLNQITELFISDNQIVDISALKKHTQLTTLILSRNKISDISPLKEFRKLQQLDLIGNPIKKLFDWIVNLNLEIQWNKLGKRNFLTFYDNPIENPPIEILAKGKDSIKNYFDQLNDAKDFLFEAKLLLVGEERSGKTTLADALKSSDFNIDFNKSSTHGITISQWIIPKNETHFEKDFCFNIWDFGGQDIYHSTHQFFLTKRSLYLFITEVRKDLRYDDFYYWLNIINTLAGDSPVILIQNKVDQDHSNRSIDEYRQLFPQIATRLIKTSCNNQHEDWEIIFRPMLDNLKKSIYSILSTKKLKGIGDELPKSWVDIRRKINELQNQDINFITETTYFEICETYGLNREQALYLSDYFHDLGVFLHFKDDIQLKDTLFINHNWITKAIYCVFDKKKVKDAYGKITEKDLMEIWTEHNFVEKQAELLNLMKSPQFKICYQHENKYYLVPQLFSDRAKTFYWPESGNLNRRYAYEFMPKGILSQLIVIMHKYIYKDIFWLHGVLFEYKDSKAFVKEDRFSKKNLISIQVYGNSSEDLLAIIIANIETINSGFTNLKIDEEFGCTCYECRESKDPYFFPSETLNRAIKRGKRAIECQAFFNTVSIESLRGKYQLGEEKLHPFSYDQLMALKKITASNENQMDQKKINIVVNPTINVNPHFDQKNENKNFSNLSIKIDVKEIQEFEQIKQLLLDLKEANFNNEEWQQTLINCLDEINKVDEAEFKENQKKVINVIEKGFQKLKNLKDIIGVGLLPVDLYTKLPRLFELWNIFKSYFN